MHVDSIIKEPCWLGMSTNTPPTARCMRRPSPPCFSNGAARWPASCFECLPSFRPHHRGTRARACAPVSLFASIVMCLLTCVVLYSLVAAAGGKRYVESLRMSFFILHVCPVPTSWHRCSVGRGVGWMRLQGRQCDHVGFDAIKARSQVEIPS